MAWWWLRVQNFDTPTEYENIHNLWIPPLDKRTKKTPDQVGVSSMGRHDVGWNNVAISSIDGAVGI